MMYTIFDYSNQIGSAGAALPGYGWPRNRKGMPHPVTRVTTGGTGCCEGEKAQIARCVFPERVGRCWKIAGMPSAGSRKSRSGFSPQLEVGIKHTHKLCTKIILDMSYHFLHDRSQRKGIGRNTIPKAFDQPVGHPADQHRYAGPIRRLLMDRGAKYRAVQTIKGKGVVQ